VFELIIVFIIAFSLHHTVYVGFVTVSDMEIIIIIIIYYCCYCCCCYYYYLFLFRSARSIGLRQCLAIRGSCFSFLDQLDIW
jgi:hypothetical protein